MVVPPRLEQFTRDDPDVVLEIMIDDSRLTLPPGASTRALISGSSLPAT
jgi:hypothetical protein